MHPGADDVFDFDVFVTLFTKTIRFVKQGLNAAYIYDDLCVVPQLTPTEILAVNNTWENDPKRNPKSATLSTFYFHAQISSLRSLRSTHMANEYLLAGTTQQTSCLKTTHS